MKFRACKYYIIPFALWFSAFAGPINASEPSGFQSWEKSSLLQNWDQCGADYTPPDWCSELPDEIDIDKSYTHHRDTMEDNKKAEAERMLKAAKILESRIGAARNIQGGKLYKQDLITISKQATSGDKEAMELLAWMYVQGMMPKTKKDLDPNEAAYIWYGRAYLAGAKEAKENMDKIWPTLSVTQQRRIAKLFDQNNSR
ncbi:hypothetical protein WH95_07645 [Kiloniella litopenaei]|uniref:Sel1 repeat family protein n=2 Tax=Kiloniella litopenaei TaxID=1549748 RepID=A0A0M2R6M2_9PROT|nr:hypothetical protein WH95_07645 [Kiloniella litopenaei]